MVVPRSRLEAQEDTDLSRDPADSVDEQQASWSRRRPDLDFSPLGIILRLGRLNEHLGNQIRPLLAANGLSTPDFAVLVTLSRLSDSRITQRRLMDELGLTSGTVSVRIDRLVRKGLVESQVDPEARRATRITLTARGQQLFDRAAPAHLANEARLLAGLTAAERGQLEDLLRRLLIEFEGSQPADTSNPRLGLTLAAAHVTIQMRTSVGLDPVPGLLVREVEPGSVAAGARLEPGDVLVRAGDGELRSIGALYKAIEASGDWLPLLVRRGAEELQLAIQVSNRPGAGRTRGRSGGAEHKL